MRILEEVLGETLALPSAYPSNSHELPSPEQLRHKILVKAKLTKAAVQSANSSKGMASIAVPPLPSRLRPPSCCFSHSAAATAGALSTVKLFHSSYSTTAVQTSRRATLRQILRRYCTEGMLEEVDLAVTPERKDELFAYTGTDRTLPQVPALTRCNHYTICALSAFTHSHSLTRPPPNGTVTRPRPPPIVAIGPDGRACASKECFAFLCALRSPVSEHPARPPPFVRSITAAPRVRLS